VPTPSPKKERKLPPRGQKGRFVKSGVPRVPRAPEPQLLDVPEYSVHRVGVGEPIDWQRELSREVLPARRRSKPKSARESNLLGWGVIAAGAIGIGYAFTKLPHRGWR